MSNLQKIKDACIKANPEIMELKFGCDIHNHHTGNKLIYISQTRAGSHKVLMPFGDTFTFPKKVTENGDWIILGRPIRLADVLLALKEGPSISFSADYSEFFEGDINIRSGIFWNLKDDNLEHQSEETINFIADLL